VFDLFGVQKISHTTDDGLTVGVALWYDAGLDQ